MCRSSCMGCGEWACELVWLRRGEAVAWEECKRGEGE